MNIEYGPTKEFIDYCFKIKNDTKFQNETLPALKFLDNSKKYLNIDILNLIKNKNDPPDFDVILSDKSKISLEVTSFAQFLAVCRRSKWSKHGTNAPGLALLAI